MLPVNNDPERRTRNYAAHYLLLCSYYYFQLNYAVMMYVCITVICVYEGLYGMLKTGCICGSSLMIYFEDFETHLLI